MVYHKHISRNVFILLTKWSKCKSIQKLTKFPFYIAKIFTLLKPFSILVFVYIVYQYITEFFFEFMVYCFTDKKYQQGPSIKIQQVANSESTSRLCSLSILTSAVNFLDDNRFRKKMFVISLKNELSGIRYIFSFAIFSLE